MMVVLGILIGFIVVGSIIAVEIEDLLSSVISMGAVGFALVLVFLILGAPDIAIVQLLMEIICLVFLLKLTVTVKDETLKKRREAFAVGAFLVFSVVFLAVSYQVFQSLPELGNPVLKVSRHFISDGMAITQSANLVTAVLLDFRAYDTLGEVAVLFASIFGAITILRKRGRRKGAEK